MERGLAQHVGVDTADAQRVRLVDKPQALEQGRFIPGQRFFQLMAPYPVVVVFQLWGISAGAGRVLDAVIASEGVLLDLIMGVLECHQLLPVMLVQAQRVGLGLGRRFDGRFVGREVRVPQHLLAGRHRHRLEMLHRALPFDGRQYLGAGGNKRHVQRHRGKMRPHLPRLALPISLYPFKDLVAHLRRAHGQHDRPQPWHHEGRQVEHADSGVEKPFQTLQPRLAVLVLGGYGHGPRITQNLADMCLPTALPEVTTEQEAVHGQTHQRGTQRIIGPTVAVIGWLVQPAETGEKTALLVHRYKAAKKASIGCAVQAHAQIDHELATGGVLLDRLLRVAGYVHHQWLGTVRTFTVWPDQQRPYQHAVQHLEGGVGDRLARQLRCAGTGHHLFEHLVGIGAQRAV